MTTLGPKIGRFVKPTPKGDAMPAEPKIPEPPAVPPSAPAPEPEPEIRFEAPRPAHTLDDCAEALLALLPKELRAMVEELALLNLRQPLPYFLMGHVIGAYERGTLSSPILDPGWTRAAVPASVAAAKLGGGDGHCEWPPCGKRFTPKRHRQKYCSNECGAAANTAQAAEEQRTAAAEQARWQAEHEARQRRMGGATQPREAAPMAAVGDAMESPPSALAVARAMRAQE